MRIRTGRSEHILGEDNFADLEVRPASSDPGNRLHYFYNTRKGVLVKRFVLDHRPRVETECRVTLIRRDDGLLRPRLHLSTRDRSTGAIASTGLVDPDGDQAVKASVDLDHCHENFWALITYLQGLAEVDLPEQPFTIVQTRDEQLARLLQEVDKRQALAAIVHRYGRVDDDDIALLTRRREALAEFDQLLRDDTAFERRKAEIQATGDEAVWQEFFERNQWIFGHGLQLVSCQAVAGGRLQLPVVGHGAFTGPGKIVDAVLRSRGAVSKLLLGEIKTHRTPLLRSNPYRPGVHVPSLDVIGAVAQVEKTIHLVARQATEDVVRIRGEDGAPTGEEIAVVRPRGVVVIGQLTEFQEAAGVNYERFASFELYRQHITSLELVTFDELHARARSIVEGD